MTLNVVTEITKMRVPVTLRPDCASLFDHVYLHKAVSEKRLLIELAVIPDAITSGEVTNLEWVATQAQLADAVAKSGYSSIFYNSFCMPFSHEHESTCLSSPVNRLRNDFIVIPDRSVMHDRCCSVHCCAKAEKEKTDVF